jgi:hypothetical protein
MVRRICRSVRRYPDDAGIITRPTGDTVFNSAVKVVAHKKEISLPVPSHHGVTGGQCAASYKLVKRRTGAFTFG